MKILVRDTAQLLTIKIWLFEQGYLFEVAPNDWGEPTVQFTFNNEAHALATFERWA